MHSVVVWSTSIGNSRLSDILLFQRGLDRAFVRTIPIAVHYTSSFAHSNRGTTQLGLAFERCLYAASEICGGPTELFDPQRCGLVEQETFISVCSAQHFDSTIEPISSLSRH